MKIKSVSFIGGDNTALIRFMREKREGQQVTISHWNVTIEFQYTQKSMNMSERWTNPLGFQVTSYRLTQEILEN